MELLGPLAAFLSVPLGLAGFVLYAVRARRRGGGGSMLSPIEEIWDPISHRTNIEIQVEGERSPETPSPGDPLRLRGRSSGDRGVPR
ncbi:hypothetical protein SAMN04488564_112101 [Lentzea waywayandensis]|uniref:Uncharacterized protein n=1 Tax=Lentzea waywayandensis TaxID=84724 RepID=A0A1I6FDK3_9PSEU|nr:hypothetical protein [Lentzea waywayandensis]SFR27990.1 hypothetical protein SAMN04488564_112101 [Lentzea waywayandensis]